MNTKIVQAPSNKIQIPALTNKKAKHKPTPQTLTDAFEGQ